MPHAPRRDWDVFERVKRTHDDFPGADYRRAGPVQLIAFVAPSCDATPQCELRGGQTSRLWFAVCSELGRSCNIDYSVDSAYRSVRFKPRGSRLVVAEPRKSRDGKVLLTVCKDFRSVARVKKADRPQEFIECKATGPEVPEMNEGVALLLVLDLPVESG